MVARLVSVVVDSVGSLDGRRRRRQLVAMVQRSLAGRYRLTYSYKVVQK
jgi:hypothetical protein